MLCIILLFGFKVGQLHAQTASESEVFLQVKPEPNDNVAVLLKRYGLYEYECNITQFFKINGLKEDYRLFLHKTYFIPVLIKTYNGKSIRSTLGIDDWKTALRIQAYNKNARSEGLRSDNFIDSKQLWVPWHELNCPATGEMAEAKLEASRSIVHNIETEEGEPAEPLKASGSRTFPIFGSTYEKTPLISRKLSGRVYYVIAGHGGPDVGAQGKRLGHTLCEDEYAYDVALRLVRLLVSHGAIAYMIVRDPDDGIRDQNYLKCDKDEYVWGNKTIPLNQKERLKQRTDIVNTLYKQHLSAGRKHQTLIEIHVDSRNQNHQTDVFFYYRPEDSESQAVANKFRDLFASKYQQLRASKSYKGTVSPRYLWTLRETVIPKAVYVELANIRNSWDQQRLVITSNRQALANWMCNALLTD
ncbi:MAG: N-acetylmuramoyl-L-alanine amidase [Saprospiraceae bacterium]